MAVSTIPDEAPRLDIDDPEHLCARLRWPDGPACPRCRSREIERQATDASRSLSLRWRCSACHRDFTVITGTALQNTRIGLGDWVRAGRTWWSAPGEIRQMLGVSHPTARRIARLLEITEQPPGDERIKALLRLPPGAAEADAEWRRSFLDPEHRRSDPLSGLSRGERQVMGVLDYIARGATVQRVAEASRLSPGHVRRCLKSLERRGFAQIEDKHLLIGYGLVKRRVWSLTRTEACNAATVCLPWRQLPPDDPPEAIPAEFWWLFWSGRSADQIDFSDEDDMLTAAETMIGGPDAVARNWALTHLPLTALRQLRTMRGYETGENAQALDSMIQARTDAQIQVFRDRGDDGESQFQWIEAGHNVNGIVVGSIPDLFAAKLDVIMYRPRLRDYIDLAALDTASPYRLEDGLRFHQQRYGTPLRSKILDRIISLLDDPGALSQDRVPNIEPEDILNHLKNRAVALREYLHQQRQADSRSNAAKPMPSANPQILAPINLPSSD